MYRICFFAIFQKNKDKIHIDKFPLYPDVQGINSSGEAYTMPRWKLILKNIALQLGYFKVK
ncbi:hypothetical protein BHF70_05930 [Anaerostipes sp. 494a]|nr:hypothetical protein BHF70_05930 [Anaerostipes sp. 494a]